MPFLRVILTSIIALLFSLILYGQGSYEPIVCYSFNDNSVSDEKGFSKLFLRNQANLYNDSQRGPVLRFSATNKSYAAFDQKLLDSDSCTISFFFYWESTNACAWHQLFELHDETTGSNFFLTPQNGWGNNKCTVISDNKEYGLYHTVNADPLEKNAWIHFTITFQNKQITIYIDGKEVSKGYVVFPPESIQADSLYLCGNPHRSNNFYISARLDDIKIFDKALSANQVLALAQGDQIPESENPQTIWEATGNPVQVEINLADKKQTIQNFGSSDGWNTQRIGKYWPEDKKEKLAELLFSTEKDADGNPKGTGLSAWRFNIGAGTAEQGDASRITGESRRTECFLNVDGESYNWDKQIGQQWFLKKAALDYKINHIIGWQNSPPVHYTKNNLGFRNYGAAMGTIFKAEHFDDYAKFLADVFLHFKGEGIHFDYLSPFNEPQYSWSAKEDGGTAGQEGSPWTNQEIHDVTVAINNEFTARNVDTKIFITEAGSLSHLLGGSGHASNQLYNFWNKNSPRSLVGTPSFANIVSYHSYWKDFGSELVSKRQELYEQSMRLDPVPEAWQTEYSLLGTGYRDGYPEGYRLTEMESALVLSKVIMTDLNIANTTGWQWWTTFEQGRHGVDARFCLIGANTKKDNSDGDYYLNKLFYSFGNFSHFIRPGMTRLGTKRSDNLTPFQETSDLMISAYTNSNESKLVFVAVNLTDKGREVTLSLKNSFGKLLKSPALYLTDEFTNLAKQEMNMSEGKLIVPAKSVVTFTANLEMETSLKNIGDRSDYKAWFNASNENIVVSLGNKTDFKIVRLYSISGTLIEIASAENGNRTICFEAADLSEGVYVVSVEWHNYRKTIKVVVTK